jgi:predicted O-methyltransferase YrrM
MDIVEEFINFDWSKSEPADWMRFSNAGRNFSESGLARPKEVQALTDAVCMLPKGAIILETGMCYGNSTRIFLGKILRDGGELHSIETTIRDRFRQAMIELGLWDKIHVHEEHSQLMCWNKPLDFLFIDSEHALSDALGEYMHYRMFVKKHALIGFHDVYSCPGVKKAIEIIHEIDNLELIIDSNCRASAGLHIYRLLTLGKC